MTLHVVTSRISCRDKDALDITRKSAGPDGLPFAPSWDILRHVLAARKEAERLRKEAEDARSHLDLPAARSFEAEALHVEIEAWAVYVPAYREEMLVSYREQRPAWLRLLARPRVVLCCYCDTAADGVLRCHRRLSAGHLARLGAIDEGELT